LLTTEEFSDKEEGCRIIAELLMEGIEEGK
jgi:hypothetical protein